VPTHAAGTIPERFSAEYHLETSNLTVAESRVSLSRIADDRFAYELRVGLTGIAAWFRDHATVERSEWRYDRLDQLRPLTYGYERTGDEPNTVVMAFDWEEGMTRSTIQGEQANRSVPDGALDKLSYLLALMQDLEQGKREMRYQVAEARRLTEYHMKAVARENVDTALGRFETVEVQLLDEGGAPRTTYWCAPALQFLPVKMVHRQADGRVISVRIQSVNGLGARARIETPRAEPIR